MSERPAPRRRRADPRAQMGPALDSTDLELEEAARVTAEDIALAQAATPAVLRPYVDAQPAPEPQ